MQLIPLGGSLELGQSLWSLGCPELRPGDRTLSHRWISHLMGTAHGRGAGVAHSSAHRGTQLGGDVRQLPRHQGGASPAEGKPPPAPAGHSVAGTRLQSPVYSRCSGGLPQMKDGNVGAQAGQHRPALSELRLSPALVRATRGDRWTNPYLVVVGLAAQVW